MATAEHNPRCRYLQDLPTLRDPNDCDCGAIPSLERTDYDVLHSRYNLAMAQRDAAVHFIVGEMVANEIGGIPYPLEIKELVARELVSNPMMGWPDLESALAHLEESFRWEAMS